MDKITLGVEVDARVRKYGTTLDALAATVREMHTVLDREAETQRRHDAKLDALIAEIANAAFKAGEDAERARVVAWLRSYPPVIGLSQMAAWNTAAAIERGEHRENRDDQS